MRWLPHRRQIRTLSAVLCAGGLAVLSMASAGNDDVFHASIPRAWDDKDVEGFELPLVKRDRSPRYMTAGEYYKLKPRTI